MTKLHAVPEARLPLSVKAERNPEGRWLLDIDSDSHATYEGQRAISGSIVGALKGRHNRPGIVLQGLAAVIRRDTANLLSADSLAVLQHAVDHYEDRHA